MVISILLVHMTLEPGLFLEKMVLNYGIIQMHPYIINIAVAGDINADGYPEVFVCTAGSEKWITPRMGNRSYS